MLLVSSLVDYGSCISLCFEDLAYVRPNLVGLSDSLVFSPHVSPRVPRVPRGILSFRERSAI